MRLIALVALVIVGLGLFGTQVVRVQRTCTTSISGRTQAGKAKKTTCEWQIKPR
jgi:hypothetical protein